MVRENSRAAGCRCGAARPTHLILGHIPELGNRVALRVVSLAEGLMLRLALGGPSAPFDQNCACYVEVSQHIPNLENEGSPKSLGMVGQSELQSCATRSGLLKNSFTRPDVSLSGSSGLL